MTAPTPYAQPVRKVSSSPLMLSVWPIQLLTALYTTLQVYVWLVSRLLFLLAPTVKNSTVDVCRKERINHVAYVP